MNAQKAETKDPVCGMTVDEATALHTDATARTSTFAARNASKNSWTHLPAPTLPAKPGVAAVSRHVPLLISPKFAITKNQTKYHKNEN